MTAGAYVSKVGGRNRWGEGGRDALPPPLPVVSMMMSSTPALEKFW